jgi:hypothetical protein
MRRILGRARTRVAVCGLLYALFGVVALLLAVGTAPADADPLNWASGASIVAPNNVDPSDPGIEINAVSCWSAGDCTAVGSYVDASGSPQGLLVTESGGSWQQGVEAQLPNSPNVDPQVNLTAVSCSSGGSSAGNCTAVGNYVDSKGSTEGVILTEAGGAWTKSTEVANPGVPSVAAIPDVSLNAVSCPASGDCLVVGTYLNSREHSEGLLEIDRNGKWSVVSLETIGSDLPTNAATELTADDDPPFLVVTLDSVSCVSGGQCVAAGTYTDSSGLQQGLLVTGVETTVGLTKKWSFSGTEAALPSDAAATPGVSLSSISCPSLGECDAVGDYQDSGSDQQGLLLTETGGAWQPGAAVQLPADAAANPRATLSSVSCASAGDCDAVGDYADSAGDRQGLLATETGGGWAQGVEPVLPADAGSTTFVQLSSVSCSVPSSCVATGRYTDDSFTEHSLLLSQSADGSWSSPATEPALPGVSTFPEANREAVSCEPSGACAAVADYSDADGNALAAAVNGTPDAPATPMLSLSAPPPTVTPGTSVALSAALSGGAGATGAMTFGVFGPQNSPPASCAFGATTLGSATVTGGGAYAPATEFTPTVAGDYWWYASYGGDLGDSPTASACGASMAETVVASPPPETTNPTPAPTTPAPVPTTTPPPSTTTGVTQARKPTAQLTAVKVSGTAVVVTIVCHATARQTCTGTLSLFVTEPRSHPAKSAKRVVLIGSRRCKLVGPTRRRLAVTLNRTGRSLLRSRRSLTAGLRLTIGNTTVTRMVTLTRRRR